MKFLLKTVHSSVDGWPESIFGFFTGWDEISKLRYILQTHPFFRQKRFVILPLHSMVAPSEQKRAFVRPPAGVRKVRLTPVASDSVFPIHKGRRPVHRFFHF